MAQTADLERPRTYGNWRRPGSPGLAALGLLGTVLLFCGLIASVLTLMFAGLWAAITVAAVSVVAVGTLAFRDRHQVTVLQRLTARWAWRRTRKARAQLYRSGPLGRARWGTYQLPGVAATLELSESRDAYDRPFAMLSTLATNTHAVLIGCEPEGDSLVDHTQIDQWAAGFAEFLGMCAHEPGLVGAALSVETAPDTGTRLQREVSGSLDSDAPKLAQDVMREIVAAYPVGSSQVRGTCALTYAGLTPSGKVRKTDQVANDLAARLPALVDALAAAGAGATRPLSAKGVCELVRVAYDPAAQQVLDDTYAAGDRPELRWQDVGPAGHEALWDRYHHDGAWSVTWTMTAPPRGIVHATVLTELLAPDPAIDRKRVTLLYRPYDSAAAARLVEADKRNADFKVSSSSARGRPTSRSLAEQRAADATAEEEARGAGLTNFGLVVTATVGDIERLPDALAAVDHLAGTARLQIRPVYGSQDSAFAAGLPLGLVLPRHLRVPTTIRDSV